MPEVSKISMSKKTELNPKSDVNILRPHQEELQLLGELAGIPMDTKIFK